MRRHATHAPHTVLEINLNLQTSYSERSAGWRGPYSVERVVHELNASASQICRVLVALYSVHGVYAYVNKADGAERQSGRASSEKSGAAHYTRVFPVPFRRSSGTAHNSANGAIANKAALQILSRLS